MIAAVGPASPFVVASLASLVVSASFLWMDRYRELGRQRTDRSHSILADLRAGAAFALARARRALVPAAHPGRGHVRDGHLLDAGAHLRPRRAGRRRRRLRRLPRRGRRGCPDGSPAGDDVRARRSPALAHRGGPGHGSARGRHRPGRRPRLSSSPWPSCSARPRSRSPRMPSSPSTGPPRTRLRGRVMGLWVTIFQGSGLFGALLSGWLAEVLGVRSAMLTGALLLAGHRARRPRLHPSRHLAARARGGGQPGLTDVQTNATWRRRDWYGTSRGEIRSPAAVRASAVSGQRSTTGSA